MEALEAAPQTELLQPRQEPELCQHCKQPLDDIEEADGFLVCMQCGTVIDEIDLHTGPSAAPIGADDPAAASVYVPAGNSGARIGEIAV